MSERKIEHKPLRDNWYDGTIGRHRFQVKVYDVGSKFGINGGRISKLSVRDAGVEIIAYDRGWDTKPATDEQWELLWDLLNCLEELPPWE